MDQLPDTLDAFFANVTPRKAAVCSVTSKWREPLFNALERYAPGCVHVAVTAKDTGMSVRYDDSETIGIDRVVEACAAHRIFGDSCVVVDAGTALTVDAVSNGGELLGGFIFPGLDTLSKVRMGNIRTKIRQHKENMKKLDN